MSNDKLSRRKFVAASAAAIGVAGLASTIGPITAAEASQPAGTMPWTIGATETALMDPVAQARRAWEMYDGGNTGQSGCAESTYWPMFAPLAESGNYPTTWGVLPRGIMNYGGEGINSYGTICGVVNGTVMAMKTMGAPTSAMNAVFEWYTRAAIPSNRMYLDYRANSTTTWIPGATTSAGKAGWKRTGGSFDEPLPNSPTSIALSPLCHASVSKWQDANEAWCMARQAVPFCRAAKSDRCTKAVADAVFVGVTVMKAWVAAGKPADPSPLMASPAWLSALSLPGLAGAVAAAPAYQSPNTSCANPDATHGPSCHVHATGGSVTKSVGQLPENSYMNCSVPGCHTTENANILGHGK